MSHSNLKDIKQNKATKDNYNHPIINLLFTDTPLTKEEIGEKLNITSDRTIRDVIAVCSMHYPILATSNQKGYRRARDINDLTIEELEKEMEEVRHQLEEHKSRIACLKKKMKPLVAWLKVAEKKVGTSNGE